MSYELKLLKTIRKESSLPDDFKIKAQKFMELVVEDALSDATPANYEILSFVVEENDNPKYLKAKMESMVLEIYFCTTKKFKFFDKEKNKIKDCIIIDDTPNFRIREIMDLRNLVV